MNIKEAITLEKAGFFRKMFEKVAPDPKPMNGRFVDPPGNNVKGKRPDPPRKERRKRR